MHRQASDVLLNDEDAALKSQAVPLLHFAIKVIQTYMTELIQYRDYRRVAAFDDIEVVLIYGVESKYELFLELGRGCGSPGDVVASRYIGCRTRSSRSHDIDTVHRNRVLE